MKSIFQFLFLFLFVFSCSDSNKNDINQKLQGDWLYNDIYNSNGFISFRNSKFFTWDYDNEFKPFYLLEDSIIVPSYNFRLKYLRVTDKYIWVSNDGKEFPLFVNTKINYKNNIKLLSLEVRFINFWDRGLFDWGLYFDENLNCFLKVERVKIYKQMKNPLSYNKGIYYAKMSASVFDFYQNKLRNLPFELIKEEYISEEYNPGGSCIKHDEFFVEFHCRYAFTNNDEKREINFISKGLNNIPGFLNVLVVHLNKVHDFMEFTSTDNKFDFKFYQDSEYYNFAK